MIAQDGCNRSWIGSEALHFVVEGIEIIRYTATRSQSAGARILRKIPVFWQAMSKSMVTGHCEYDFVWDGPLDLGA